VATATTIRQTLSQNPWVLRAARWMNNVPHPNLAIEFGMERLTIARWGKPGTSVNCVVESLPPGALVPSAVETNIINGEAVAAALGSACKKLSTNDEDVTLLLPDPVVRVFLQHFEEFPRSAREALPMLRWKLKKSLPFDESEAVLSFMRQTQGGTGCDVAVAIARQRIVREYEALVESVGLKPGVILSSCLTAVALQEGPNPTLLARVSDKSLTTAIVCNGVLQVYRCTELSVHGRELTPQALLEEIFPVAAYYQDTWHNEIQGVMLAGLGARWREFVGLIESELRCPVRSLLESAVAGGQIPGEARVLARQELEGMAGWMLNND